MNGKFYTYTSEQTVGAVDVPEQPDRRATADHQNVVSEWQRRALPITRGLSTMAAGAS